MNNIKEKIKDWLLKLKKVKHIEIYIAVGVAVVVALIYFAFLLPNKQDNQTSNTEIDINSETFLSSSEYTDYLENKLENVITSIKGVGETKVAVTLEKGFEFIYLTEEETKISSNGTTITTVSIVMVDGQPVVKEEIFPVVKGIVVIANGAEDVGVRMNILSIIQTIININLMTERK
jgi:stage III sporulation protein AG